MALKATIVKAELAIADMHRHYYHTHALTLAQHPSETTERLMLRLVAFALLADPQLQFGKGISDDSEPDLWQHSLSGEIDLWVELGLPEEKALRKASHKAKQALVLAYGGSVVDKWWQREQKAAQGLDNLVVIAIDAQSSAELANICQRTMQLQCTLQEGQLWFSDGQHSVVITPTLLKQANPAWFSLESL
jgi:uncharacterized protein YaeQ